MLCFYTSQTGCPSCCIFWKRHLDKFATWGFCGSKVIFLSIYWEHSIIFHLWSLMCECPTSFPHIPSLKDNSSKGHKAQPWLLSCNVILGSERPGGNGRRSFVFSSQRMTKRGCACQWSREAFQWFFPDGTMSSSKIQPRAFQLRKARVARGLAATFQLKSKCEHVKVVWQTCKAL